MIKIYRTLLSLAAITLITFSVLAQEKLFSDLKKNTSISSLQHKAVDNLSFEVKEPAFIAIIGHNGSGKSSLLKTIYGDLILRSGNAQVADFDLAKMTWKTVPYLRRKLGIIFQDLSSTFLMRYVYIFVCNR